MDYPQILSPIYSFLHCKTPDKWLDEAAYLKIFLCS